MGLLSWRDRCIRGEETCFFLTCSASLALSAAISHCSAFVHRHDVGRRRCRRNPRTALAQALVRAPASRAVRVAATPPPSAAAAVTAGVVAVAVVVVVIVS